MQVTAKELRTRVSEILDCLDRGEPVTLTYRGKPRARLVGIEDERDSVDEKPGEDAAFGIWKDREDVDDVDAHARKLRRGRSHADRF